VFCAESRGFTHSGAAFARSIVGEVSRSSESDRTHSRISEECTFWSNISMSCRSTTLDSFDANVLDTRSPGVPRYLR
jgi:hypothetical protein